jgi:hypothetical protein
VGSDVKQSALGQRFDVNGVEGDQNGNGKAVHFPF